MALTKVTKELIQGGLGIDWQATIKTGNFQSVASQGYFVNTTSNEVTVTMPPSPVVGDMISIVDYAGTAQTNNIKITAQANINGSANDVKIDYQRGAVSIVYSGTAQGWLAEYAANDGTNALVNSPITISAYYLVVAGGGGGGGVGGGGGAGGYRTNYLGTSLTLVPGTNYTVTIGAGGAPSATGAAWNGDGGIGANGTNSVFSTITSAGGGGGAGASNNAGSGGSGGGSRSGTVGSGNTPSVTPSQGNSGGNSNNNTYIGGGGGGASQSGNTVNNNGGNGSANSITGTSATYAGGGGGGGSMGSNIGIGGTGGGAQGGAYAGAANTGGGGGGGSWTNNQNTTTQRGGAGGSGIVILRYPDSYNITVGSGLTAGTPNTSVGSNEKYSTFTAGTGTITFS